MCLFNTTKTLSTTTNAKDKAALQEQLKTQQKDLAIEQSDKKLKEEEQPKARRVGLEWQIVFGVIVGAIDTLIVRVDD